MIEISEYIKLTIQIHDVSPIYPPYLPLIHHKGVSKKKTRPHTPACSSHLPASSTVANTPRFLIYQSINPSTPYITLLLPLPFPIFISRQ